MLLPRSLSVRRFAVSGKPPAPTSPEFLGLLEQYSFLPVGAEEESSMGWVAFDNFLDTRPQDGEPYLHGVLRLGLRIDKVSIPSAHVKAQLDIDLRAERAVGDGKVPKHRVKELREGVVQALRSKVMPKTAFIRGLWRLKDKRLYLLGTSESAAEQFSSFFSKTFERNGLTALDAGALIGELAEIRPLIGSYDTIESADFTPPGTRKRSTSGG